MMDWTDRHDRFFLRLISARALLYTEMLTTGAVIFGDREKLLGYSPQEHPIAIQLGGSEPEELAKAARIAEDWGYDEVNLNVGCPSDRVQSGRFGACLMREPDLVADCMAAMGEAVDVPVTVKCRIGVDDQDPEHSLRDLIDKSAAAGVGTFIVHARKAWLDGLSPKDNRSVPPLDYDLVYRVKAERPDLEIILNGGIETVDECRRHMEHVDGVMMGRTAYQTPYVLAEVDRLIYGEETPVPSREEIIVKLRTYIEAHLAAGGRLHQVTRHIMGLYQGRPRGRVWRRILSTHAVTPGAALDVLEEAMAVVTGAKMEEGEHGRHLDTVG